MCKTQYIYKTKYNLEKNIFIINIINDNDRITFRIVVRKSDSIAINWNCIRHRATCLG